MKSALLFGASGLVGSHLLTLLLDNPAYDKVIIVVRKPLEIQHPKLTMLIGDFNTLPSLKDQLKADEVFIALGTTKKKTPDRGQYYQIDHDYPFLAAKLAKENGARSVLLVSAVGAHASSKIFYVRTKGRTENDIIGLNFDHTYIFQPSMLMGDRKEKRAAEKFFIALFQVLGPFLVGGASKYRGIKVSGLAKSMIEAAGDESVKVKRYRWEDMQV